MTDKLAVILLDALGPDNIYFFEGFENIREYYYRNGDVLGISTLPNTAQSNPMIWGEYLNENKFWVDVDDWIFPPMYFPQLKDKNQTVDDDATYFTRYDYETSFIWDTLDYHGYDPAVIQVPICLPPFSYNADDELEDSWFPDKPNRMKQHVREKTDIVMDHARKGYDFIGTSIHMPDKWLHGVGNHLTKDFIQSESWALDRKVKMMVETFEKEGYDWIMCGDHGSPCDGVMPVHEAKEVLGRHKKESVIFGSKGLDLPKYTDEMYEWMLEFFGVDDVPYQELELEDKKRLESTGEVEKRLENLGYR